MRELILKRQTELEQIYEAVHMDLDMDKARQLLVTLIESGYSFFSFSLIFVMHSYCLCLSYVMH